MTIRRILLPLTGTQSDAAALATGIATAVRLKAHLDAALLVSGGAHSHPVLDEHPSAALAEEVAALHAARAEQVLDQAALRFEEACSAAGLLMIDRPRGPGAASARWLGSCSPAEIVRRVSVADLLLLGRAATKADMALAPIRNAALLSSGRPLLLAPSSLPDVDLFGKVVIAWNGRPEAARAVAAALPLLGGAAQVCVLTAGTPRTRTSEAERLAEYLLWHGIASQAVPVEAAAGEPVGGALLRAAGSIGADLLVMGGHGHSRLREFLLGGVTRYVFDHADLAVFVAH